MTPDDHAPEPEFVRIRTAQDHTTGTTGATGNGSHSASSATDDIPSPERDRAPRSRDMRKLEEQLTDAYTQIGIVIGIVGGKTGNLTGYMVARRADVLAANWIDLAERDIRVKRAIQNILQVGGWSGVIVAHAGILLPTAAIAGVLPEPIAQKIMLGLAMQDPELFAHLTAQAQAMNGNSAS